MGQGAVITIADVTGVELKERRPGCERGLLQADGPSHTVLYRILPGSGIPTHLHSRVYDLFVGIKGALEIRFESQRGNGTFVLKLGGFCSMPPGVRHEISNPSKTDEAFFLLVHAPGEGHDSIPAPFRELETALSFSPRA